VLVHDALERWDFRDGRALRGLAREAALRAARRESLEPGPLETEAESVVDALLSSDLPAHLAGVEVIGRELPLLFRDADGTAWSGTIDLLYRDRDGRLVIADYKTDRAPDAEARALTPRSSRPTRAAWRARFPTSRRRGERCSCAAVGASGCC
jgi:ATP-dependent exoDNAse (exonuclease V) beta subunit